MRRVLVLAYYFPPLGGSGVQRITKLVKYLPRYGWQPEVLCPRPGRYLAHDASLLEEVEAAGIPIHRTASLDPTRRGRGVAGSRSLSDGRQRLAGRITGALFLPDNKIGWMPFALREGRRLIRERSFDAILSTAPPYSSHLVAVKLGKASGLPVVLDYRDAWLDNPRHVYPTGWHYRRHASLERQANEGAAALVTINDTIARSLTARMGPGVSPHVIPQGFDPADFEQAPAVRSGHGFRIVFTGLFYDAQRPDAFLQGLARFLGAQSEARGETEVLFAGRVPSYFDGLVDALGIRENVRYLGYLPHPESVALLKSADLLWMTVGEASGAAQISTSKLFEYMGTRKPILGLVPEGEAAEALRQYGCGTVVAPAAIESITRALAAYWEEWRAGRVCAPDETYLQRHDRIKLAGQMADVLSRVAAIPGAGRAN